MLKAVLIDFDGVIIDTEVLYYEVFKQWFKTNANHDLTIPQFQLGIGTTDNVIFEHLAKEHGVKADPGSFNQVTHEKIKHASRSLPPKEGVIDFVKQVKAQNLSLALVTSNKRDQPTYHLKRFGIIDHFDHLVTSEDVTKVKPSPELYQKALDLLNIEPTQAIAIEDSLNGFKAARAAGIQTIPIPHALTESLVFEGAYKRLKSLKEVDLLEIMKDFE